MTYDNNKTIYSKVDTDNDREINELKNSVSILESEVSTLKEEVSELDSNIETVELKSVNGEIESLKTSSIRNTNGVIWTKNVEASDTLTSHKVDTVDIETDTVLVNEDVEIKGNLKVDGEIDGTLKELDTTTLTSNHIFAKNIEFKDTNSFITEDTIRFKGGFFEDGLTTKDIGVTGTLTIGNNVSMGQNNCRINNPIIRGKLTAEGDTEVKKLDATDVSCESISVEEDGTIGGKLSVSNVVNGGKYVTMTPHSTGDDAFIRIKPFNGLVQLKLVNNENVILAINIAETFSSNGTVSARISYSTDVRDNLKLIELTESGSLYFKTLGDGKLYYQFFTVDDSAVAPLTYYPTRPNDLVKDYVEIKNLTGNVELESNKYIEPEPQPIEDDNETGNIPVGIIFKIDSANADSINELGGIWEECNEEGELI